MEHRIKSGEYAVLEPNTLALSGDDVLIRTINNEYMIKTFEYKKEVEYRFSLINHEHPPFNLSAIIKGSRFIAFEDIEQNVEVSP